MGRKRYTPEQIISMLREAEVLQIQGSKMADVCRKLGISAQTYCQWRKEYGGMVSRFPSMNVAEDLFGSSLSWSGSHRLKRTMVRI